MRSLPLLEFGLVLRSLLARGEPNVPTHSLLDDAVRNRVVIMVGRGTGVWTLA